MVIITPCSAPQSKLTLKEVNSCKWMVREFAAAFHLVYIMIPASIFNRQPHFNTFFFLYPIALWSFCPILHASVFSGHCLNGGVCIFRNGKSSVNLFLSSAVRMRSLPQRTHLRSTLWGRVEHQRRVCLHQSSLPATV